MKYLIHKLESCFFCPWFEDEGLYCNNPEMRDDDRLSAGSEIPDVCPLPDRVICSKCRKEKI